MNSRILGMVAGLLALGLVAGDAQAQRRATVGIAAGATVPMGDLGDATELGFHVLGTVGIGGTAASPAGFRLDGMYNALGGKDDGPDFRILSLTGNVLFSFPGESSVTPYIIGGAGVYNAKADVSGVDSETDLGINAGVGARFALSGFSTFAELRYHNVFSDPDSYSFIPLTFGIIF
jgi:opacity protein-like surface antigen